MNALAHTFPLAEPNVWADQLASAPSTPDGRIQDITAVVRIICTSNSLLHKKAQSMTATDRPICYRDSIDVSILQRTPEVRTTVSMRTIAHDLAGAPYGNERGECVLVVWYQKQMCREPGIRGKLQ